MPGKENACQSATTGYLALRWIEALYPGEPVTLVNFGYEVMNSTYRTSYHNWKYEDSVLAGYPHIYTGGRTVHESMNVAYCVDRESVQRAEMSADTVLRNNPNARILMVSQARLATRYENIVVPSTTYGRWLRELVAAGRSSTGVLRLLLPDVLPDLDRVISLDPDTICKDSLDALWRQDIEYIGAAHSHDAGVAQAKELGIKQYSLTSVMLMNLAELRQAGFTGHAMFAASNFSFPGMPWYGDETVVNACFGKYIRPLSTRWCYCMNRSYSKYIPKDSKRTPDEYTIGDAAILYYIGGQHSAQQDYYQHGIY